MKKIFNDNDCRIDYISNTGKLIAFVNFSDIDQSDVFKYHPEFILQWDEFVNDIF